MLQWPWVLKPSRRSGLPLEVACWVIRIGTMYDAIVAGGGIVGLSTAYHLVSSGGRTLLVDRADPGQATAAGAGILAPATSTSESEAWVDFATAAVAYYPALI